MTLAKIISGGQTGVDRGALDAALEAAFPCGGWAPGDRAAEDGRIHARYPLQELAGAGYEERTLQNALDSDGTAILHSGTLEGGTRQTLLNCIEHGKPFELVDAARIGPREAASRISAFIERHRVSVLNVAGPRASKWPEGHRYAHSTVQHLLSGRGDSVIPAKPALE
ncbi:MAG TPA: putative molybdenum carrier protein [Burkholderiales bacterium]